ncbi:TrkH family potassium uptake protein [Candidatus Bipolaricaulota bacterium]|nr:TrkH family potassium uptake protein [Candidatus Bipolaricaulota bacterium]MCF7889878.1 TrkH family potassium uptake protein [Candidatus Bipolaricaulota bacterium]
MKISEHLRTANWHNVLHELFGALGLLGLLLLVPFFVSILFREFLYTQLFGGLSFGSIVIGFGVWHLDFFNSEEMNLIDALIVTALVYLLFSLVGAVPFLPIKTFLDGLFEAMSGFTTTGLTMVNETTLSPSLHFFRAYSQWLGGMGIIVLTLAILLRPGKSAFKLYASEFGEANIQGSVISTAKAVIKVYISLTTLGFVAFYLAGMGLYDALIHILTTIPTGGFSLYSESIGFYNSEAISMTVTLFMILGAISFPLYYLAVKGEVREFFEDHQVQALIALVLLGSLVFIISFGPSPANVVPGIFQTTTAITTTGYNTVPTGALPDGDKFVTILFMIIGGGTGSTAGGIKLFRLLILLGLIRLVFFRSLLPKEAKLPLRFGNITVGKEEAESIIAFFLSYLLILVISTLAVLWLEGTSLVNSLFEVASAEGTVGMSVGLTSPDLHPVSKLILIVNMWLGRLEITPVLVALYPGSWR